MDKRGEFALVTSVEGEDNFNENDDKNEQELYKNQDKLKRGITRRMTVSDLGKPADIVLTLKYRNQTCIRYWNEGVYEYFSVCSTPLEKIGEFGLGLELYLRLIRRMAFTFFLISCISVYALYLNNQGQGMNAGKVRQRWDLLSIGNTDIAETSEEIEENQKLLQKLFILDAISSFFLIFFIISYQIECNSIIRNHSKKSVTVSDYSIEIKGIPESICDKSIVSKHFEQFGIIHEVFLAKQYKGILSAYTKRADLLTSKAYYQVLKEKGRSVDKKLQKIQKNIEKLDLKIQQNENTSDLNHDELPTLRGYLIYENMNSRKTCLLAYKRDSGCCRKYSRSRNLHLLGKYPLSIRKADAPSNIIYTNLEVKKASRRCRRFLSIICILIVFAASIAMVYSLRLYQNNLPQGENCKDVNYQQSFDYAKENYKSDTDSFCWCKEQKYQDLLENDKFEYCDYYFQRTSLIVLIRIIVSFGIITVNFLIKLILKNLSKFERAANRNKEQVKIMNRVFYATFINTAIVILAVNADFSNLKSSYWMPDYLFNGEFNDFTRKWYSDVGSTIVSTLMISIFTPHWVNLCVFYPLGGCRRKCGIRGCVTQEEANKKFSGVAFDLAIKNSFVIRSIFACFLYSSGIPLLNIVCFLLLFGLYWIEKFLVLRHYEKPPMLSQILNDEIIKFLPFAVVFHCAFALYMFGATDIFPYEEGQENSLADRIQSFVGIIYLLLIALALTSFVWVYLYGKCFNCWMRRKVTVANFNMNSSIQDEVRNLRNHGLDTYDLSKHPEFMGIIRAMNTAAQKAKERKGK